MKTFKLIPFLLLLLTVAMPASAQKKTQKTYIPWNNGKLMVSEEGRYLKHENGTPFFWLGETGWLLPQRLNRDEAEYYLEQCKQRGYNVIQVQTLNNVPSINTYGQYSMTDGYNFKNINQKGVYGYWDHMDYIIRTAAKKGQYIGMVCIWGSPVNRGEMTVEQAKEYIAEEQFAKGSMLPKIEAAIRFAESGEGRRTLITLLDKAAEGIAGKTGTVIHQ